MNNFAPKPLEHTYPLESAGRVMSTKVPTVLDSATAHTAKRVLTAKPHQHDSLNYVFVTDKHEHLVGVISIKEVFALNDNTPIGEVMSKEPVSVRPYTDQERAALLAMQHNIKMVPVVNKQGVFLGAVTSDTITDIVFAEAQEDLFQLAGVSGKADELTKTADTPILKGVRRRLPWLVVGLLGGLVTAGIVRNFNEILQTNLILASFIPLVSYIGGASSTQLQAFIIRDMAVEPDLAFGKYFSKQMLTVGLLGLILGAGIWGLSFFLYSAEVGMIVGASILLAVLSSVVSGLVTPYVFGKLSLDPANTTGPISTLAQDLIGVTIYLSVAQALLL